MKHPLTPMDGSPAALRTLAVALQVLHCRTDAQVHESSVQVPTLPCWPGRPSELRGEGAKPLVPADSKTLAAGMACVQCHP